MKKFTKAVLIIAAVFAVIGVGCCVAALALGVTRSEAEEALTNDYGQRVRNFSSRIHLGDWDHEDDQYTIGTGKHTFGDIRYIDVEFVSGDLHLLPAKDDMVTVNVKRQETGKETSVYLNDSDTLMLENDYRNSNCEVEIYIPDNVTMENMEINMDAGTVTVDTLNTRYLDVEIGAGEFKSSGKIYAEESDWELGTGAIDVKELECINADFSCDVGTIDVAIIGSENDYDQIISCDMGTVTIGGRKYASMSEDHDRMVDNPVGTIEADCGVGTIDITFKENK